MANRNAATILVSSIVNLLLFLMWVPFHTDQRNHLLPKRLWYVDVLANSLKGQFYMVTWWLRGVGQQIYPLSWRSSKVTKHVLYAENQDYALESRNSDQIFHHERMNDHFVGRRHQQRCNQNSQRARKGDSQEAGNRFATQTGYQTWPLENYDRGWRQTISLWVSAGWEFI